MNFFMRKFIFHSVIILLFVLKMSGIQILLLAYMYVVKTDATFTIILHAYWCVCVCAYIGSAS